VDGDSGLFSLLVSGRVMSSVGVGMLGMCGSVFVCWKVWLDLVSVGLLSSVLGLMVGLVMLYDDVGIFWVVRVGMVSGWLSWCSIRFVLLLCVWMCRLLVVLIDGLSI